jgi:hypothetical protein
MEDVGMFNVHLVHFTAMSHILLIFGIFHGYLVFSPFWYVIARKMWQPWFYRLLGNDFQCSIFLFVESEAFSSH